MKYIAEISHTLTFKSSYSSSALIIMIQNRLIPSYLLTRRLTKFCALASLSAAVFFASSSAPAAED